MRLRILKLDTSEGLVAPSTTQDFLLKLRWEHLFLDNPQTAQWANHKFPKEPGSWDAAENSKDDYRELAGLVFAVAFAIVVATEQAVFLHSFDLPIN